MVELSILKWTKIKIKIRSYARCDLILNKHKNIWVKRKEITMPLSKEPESS